MTPSKAWEEAVQFAIAERAEHPEICMNVLASTILAADAELKRLREAVEKAACGPRLDPSKCSGCDGTGIGNCICGGKGG